VSIDNILYSINYGAPFLGGIMLIIGSIFKYKGKEVYSMFSYLIADICWVIIAYFSQNTFGAISIIIGVLFSLGVFYKMKVGIFVTDLRKDKNA